MQIKILKVLHQQWKDREGKFIISTGSASIYQPGLTGEVYQQDKKELRDALKMYDACKHSDPKKPSPEDDGDVQEDSKDDASMESGEDEAEFE